jgi:ubiquitin-protein ligase
MAEYKAFLKAEHKTIFLEPEKADILSSFRAVVVGPPDSPYEGGFFRFHIVIPDTYPLSPPIFKCNIPIRLHPNLYAHGKVCLSILGTWGAFEWSPMLTLEKVLLTIQGLLDSNPLANEPSFERVKVEDKKAESYAVLARYHTLKYCSANQPALSENEKGFVHSFYDTNQELYTNSKLKLEPFIGKEMVSIHAKDVITPL